jgi:flagellar protein FliO/FliZ
VSSINTRLTHRLGRRLAQGWIRLCALIWLLTPVLAGAAETAVTPAPFAAPEQIAPAHGGMGAVRVMVALLIVLGAVVVAGRMARRMRGFGGGSTAGLVLLGQLPVGPRERAVLIRVGRQQLLLGVAPGQVRTLHVFEEPAATSADSSEAHSASASATSTAMPAPGALDRPTFRSILMKSLGK